MTKVKDSIVEEVIDYKDKYIRLYAEFENYKKRITKDIEAITDKIKIEAVEAVIPLYESILSASRLCENSDELDVIESQIVGVLQNLNVEIIDVKDELNPKYHEVIMGRGTKIIQEVAPGFKFKDSDKVIRAAKVICGE